MSLTRIVEQDFRDNGEVYEIQLNRITRHILDHPREDEPDAIYELREDHDISAIVAQLQSENATDLAMRRIGKTRQYSATLDVPHISRNSGDYWTAVAGTEPQPESNQTHPTAENQIDQRTAVCYREVLAPLRRSPELRHNENTAGSSNLPTIEAVEAAQGGGRTVVHRKIFFW